MGLASLGALGNGLVSGIQTGQAIDARSQALERQKIVNARQDQQWAREDADRAALDEANAAGRAVMQKYADEWKKQQPGPTLDGSPVAVNPFKPTPQMALEAGQARTDKLLELKGPTDVWAKSWAGDEAMRSQVRAAAGQSVKAALASGADLTEPLSTFFSTINDGSTVTGVTPTKGIDGKVTLQVQRANRYSGQAMEPMTIPADQLARDIDMMAANPVELAKHSLAMNLEAFKQAGRLSEIDARAKVDAKAAGTKHGYTIDEIDKRGAVDKAVAGIRAAGSAKSAQAEAIRALAQERTSVDNEIRTLVQQLKDARSTDRPGIQAQLSDARQRSADVRRRLSELSTGSGGSPSATPPSQDSVPASAGLPPGLPAGSRQIGTSGGKPVYQTPDGRRLIQE